MVTQTRAEFALARELGMTHGELLQRMTVAEFQQWLVLLDTEATEREDEMKKVKK